jgi:hypothetical protein
MGIIAAAVATLSGAVAGAAVRWGTVYYYWRNFAGVMEAKRAG